ncbi:hypothetical protein EVG20_g2546 [Dentipellis fragilis]|uniref:Uncharacterized protein n=1 Tax=Dentipellis fragilis TaxID=205917 RepID=A0A4Y9Z7Q1_9AGAM|nr:hypothetical protein EVG20_g2546 [Dentipellis fragilis]
MSPGRPPADLKVQVPRHNTQRIGPALTGQVESLARSQGLTTDIRQPTNESSSSIAQAIESASDWNSLLTTARADRGPQWDVGTQQFLVEEESELYYDPSPLLEYLKEGQSEDGPSGEGAPPNGMPGTPLNRGHQPMGGQYQVNGMMSSPAIAASPRHGLPGQYPGSGFTPIPPSSFYGTDRGSPMVTRSGMMQNMDGLGVSPDLRRRM